MRHAAHAMYRVRELALKETMTSIRWAFNYGSWNPTKEEWMLAAQSVQQEEKTRIGRFMFQRDAKAAMCGRLLMRRMLSYTLGIPYRDVELGRTEKGKPFLKNNGFPYLSFNISHQGDYAVLVADSHYNVGIDVMKVEYPRGSRSVSDFFGHMYRQFSDQEWAKIRSATDEHQQLAAFYRNWSLKESYVKALGTGLGFSLQRADFHTLSIPAQHTVITDTLLLVDSVPQNDVLFQETMLDDKHHVSVALQKNQGTQPILPSIPMFYQLSIEELLEGCQPLLPPDETYWLNFSVKQSKPG